MMRKIRGSLYTSMPIFVIQVSLHWNFLERYLLNVSKFNYETYTSMEISLILQSCLVSIMQSYLGSIY